MKVDIRPVAIEDYENLYDLVALVEDYKGFQFFDQFCQGMNNRVGFTYWVDNKLIGLVSFSDYYASLSVVIHCDFHPNYIEAMNRKVICQVFRYAFNNLKVNRITTYIVKGITDKLAKFIKGLGFKKEGKLEEAVELNNKFYDLIVYGMIRKNCKWL